MRTTLDIEPDILQAAKEIATKDKSTAGAVISQLARKGLMRPDSGKMKFRNGVPVFPATGHTVTLAHVGRIMNEEGI